MTKCGLGGCGSLSLAISEFCWNHLPDKEGYKRILAEAVKSGEDLSGSNLSQADLSGAHLFDAKLERANLIGTNLSDCDLTHCNLRGADLTKVNLTCARLWNADLTGSNLTECSLSHADLWNAKLFNVKLWGAVFTGTKSITKRSFVNPGGGFRLFDDPKINEAGELAAEASYRDLKQYFISNGMYNDASWASFKEKTMERIILKKRGDLHYLPSLIMNILCGYGEKPYRIVLSSLLAILLFAGIYSSFNAIEPSPAQNYPLKWSDYLYYSTITYTTVGYGDFIPKGRSLFRLLAAAEAFIGVFLTGLFIFTLARKHSAR